MNRELEKFVNGFDGVKATCSENTVKVEEVNDNESLHKFLNGIYNLEKVEDIKELKLDFKGCKLNTIAEALRYSMKIPELRNPSMILNIYNLIKTHNTMDDSFFNSPDVYVSSLEDMLDLALDLKEEIKMLRTAVGMNFISVIRTYNKFEYEPIDEHKPLPNLYKMLMMMSDIAELSSILDISSDFKLSECGYVDDGMSVLNSLLDKAQLSYFLVANFLKSHGGDHDN